MNEKDPLDLEASFYSHLAQTSESPYGLHLEKADGCFVWDTKGKKYLDLVAGISVANIGHRHPSVIKAIHDQSEKYLHTMVYGEYLQDIQIRLTEKLAELLPPKLNCTFLVNSGTESVEAALKLAKRQTGRNKIVSFHNAYHGSTHGSLSVSGNEMKKRAFRPLLPNIHFIHFNLMTDLEVIDDQTAAVILEPVQGDAGVRVGSKAYMQQLRKKCDEHETLLIFDEIQCGLGRTGKMFAFEHYEIVPDILCLAKSLGGGLPIGAMISATETMKVLTNNPPLGHITTFGGNPLSCASALANLKVIQNDLLMQEIESKGRYLKSLLDHPEIKEVRQIGLMLAVDLENERKLAHLIDLCKSEGVIIYRFLSNPYSFRLSPPLNISKDLIQKGASIILKCLDQI